MKATHKPSTQKRNSATQLALRVALGLMLLPALGNAGPTEGPRASFVKGEVQVGATPEGKFARLKRGREVTPGSFVRTGEGARAELKFKDGSVVRIGPSSMLHVKESGFDSASNEVRVETALIGGKAWANVSKLVGSEARFQVKTQNAVAGVRGTVFRVNLDEDAATVVKVYDGAVAVSNSPFFAKAQDAPPVNPISPDRKEIAAPFAQVSKKEFEQIVQRMMQVRVAADGTMSSPQPFTDEKSADTDAEWVAWNLSCDKGACEY